MDIDSLKTYIGIVEDNNDPKRLGRCRIRIIDIFNDIPTEDIPWASPWKDLNGNGINIPEVGKLLVCTFDMGNIYKPEYIYAEHFNINLEKKLSQLSEEGYKTMRTIMHDHKTQIFSNDDDGLVIDYKFNNINILDDSINLNLKDNYSKLALGDENADQAVILGTNFIKWFDEFLKNMIGAKGGPFFGNNGAPVTPNPEFANICQKFFDMKDTKFLSNIVYTVDNSKVETVSKQIRPSDSIIGDDIKTTRKMTEITPIVNDTEFTPSYDDNAVANTTNDPLSKPIESKPVYSEEFEPQSGIVSDFASEIVRIGLTQETIMEQPPASNRGPEVEVYQRATALQGTGWAWCAAFVCYCFKAASQNENISYNFTLPKTAGAFDFENWAKQNSKYVEIFGKRNPIKDIKKGDIVIFKFSHVGIAIGNNVGNKFPTIEGNTDLGGSREGGGVYKKNRNMNGKYGLRTVIRLKYNDATVKNA